MIPKTPLPSPELTESMLTPAGGHMGCFVQPWSPWLLAHPSSPALPLSAACLSHLSPAWYLVPRASEGSGKRSLFCPHLATTSSFQTTSHAGKQGIFPCGSPADGGVPTPRLTAPSGRLLGEVAETMKPIGLSRWQTFSYCYLFFCCCCFLHVFEEISHE